MLNYINIYKSKLINCVFAAFLICTLSSCSNSPANNSVQTYEFITDQSNVIQSGGFAGVNKTHSIEGTFQLITDMDNNTASFEKVDANILEPTGFLPTQKLDELFNLAKLKGTFTDNTTMLFSGKTSEPESDISITVTLTNNTVSLKGGTTPPPNSADFFIFHLDAVAKKK